MSDHKIYKPKPVSGFPEWLPEVRIVEQEWFDHIRRVFESYGFCSIETPSVEMLDMLRAKGEVDKEIYVIDRLHKDENEKEARLALHFDQTVPVARYVAQHFNDLVFPFKRYQIQRVWRGERPQAGRFREFYQCDIDVIGIDNLPLHFDAEMPAIIWEALTGLSGIESDAIQIRISNRKILMGYLDSIKISTKDGGTTALPSSLKAEIVRDIDKLAKLGKDVVLRRIEDAALVADFGFNVHTFVQPFIDICDTPYETADELEEALTNNKEIDTSNLTLRAGIEELKFVMEQLTHLPRGAVVADLSIVRGLDYYTGTVYETVFRKDPNYGSICSGGRYDDLASSFINKKMPGVGISIGFSRLFDRIRQTNRFNTQRKSPADILMLLPSEEQRSLAANTAKILRDRNFKVEMYHAPQKLPKQLSYAEKKGIPYVWFPPFKDGQPHEVKNMSSGEQSQADPADWKG